MTLINGVLKDYAAQALQSGKTLVLTCGPRKRTSKQNKRYWGKGVLSQIAEQATVGGRLFSAATWHELMKQKFIGVIELPNGSVIGESSTGLDTAEFCNFCDRVEAYAASELGVCFEDLPVRTWAPLVIDNDTGEILEAA